MARFVQTGPTEYNEEGSIKRSSLAEVSRETNSSHFVGIFNEIHAPDGTRIASSSQLKEFERRTGMTNDLDSLRSQAAAQNHRAQNRTGAGTSKQRKAAIHDALQRVSSSGFNRRVMYDE